MRSNANNICNVRVSNKSNYVIIAIISIVLVIFISGITNVKVAKAESLNDSILEQLDNIDFSMVDSFLNSINLGGTTFIESIKEILNGNFSTNYNGIFNSIFSLFFGNVANYLPTFLAIICIAILLSIINSSKGIFLSNEIKNLIFFIAYVSITILVLTSILQSVNNVKNLISKIAEFTNVITPILLTLMVASGGNVSAGLYKPTVAFLTNGIINVINYLIIPLISLIIVLNILSNMSSEVKLKKFSELFGSIIKWVLGIFCTIFTIFLTVQGLTSASIDGMSLRLTKYAIQNSVPIVGGFLGGGLDVIVVGAVLIKSVVGVGGTGILLYLILSPLLSLIATQILLKLTSAITETMGEDKISNFTISMSKTISYLIATSLIVGFMLLVVFILLIASASGVI